MSEFNEQSEPLNGRRYSISKKMRDALGAFFLYMFTPFDELEAKRAQQVEQRGREGSHMPVPVVDTEAGFTAKPGTLTLEALKELVERGFFDDELHSASDESEA